MNETLRRRDVDFILYDLLRVDQAIAPCFAHVNREMTDQVLDTAFRVAREQFAPIASQLDENEPVFEAGRVKLPGKLREALDAYIASGFLAAGFPLESGGLQMPYSICLAAHAAFTAANNPAAGYVFLTSAAANLLLAHGSSDQQDRYLRPMMEGRYFGTMCLSEPQAGSSMAGMRTTARLLPDGRFAVSGTKTWISGGDHDLSENIIHLVLARREGAPRGTKGISLFIVPKLRPDGSSNHVGLAGLNHKLGHRGTTNCVLSFGDGGDSVAELVGEPNSGLRYMFHMMNEARIGVGSGAAVTAYAAYLHALDYARERRQGRHLDGRPDDAGEARIIEHPDVKRMLLAQKAVAEGGLALCLYCASLVDQMRSSDASRAEEARLLLDLLTPIAKSWPSEHGVQSNSLAIQVLGGAGYSRDHPVERWYRDQRLNPIHEGTTGIQAMDLLGRKVGAEQGAALALLLALMARTADAAEDAHTLSEEAAELRRAAEVLEETSGMLTRELAGDRERALANATLYLDLAGSVVIAWIWLRQALAAAPRAEDPFLAGKIAACRYFFRYELPRALADAPLLQSLDRTTIEFEEAGF